jgi:AraC-like DNA-binding protein
MTRRATTSIRTLLPLEAACPQGLRAWFWRELAVDPALRNDPEARVPAAALLRAIALAEAATGDPHVGFRIAVRGSPNRLDVLLYLAANSRHVAQALTRVQTYARLCNDAIQLSLETGRHGATLIYEPQGIALTPASPGLRSLFEMGTATFVRQLRSALQDEVAPTEVRFATSPPADPSVLEHFYRAPLTFSRARTEIRFPSAWLQRPIPSANLELGSVLERYASSLAEHLPADDASIGERVRAHLTRALRPQQATLTATARALAISSRSLQRALAAEGTNFRTVCDDVCSRLALFHLDERTLSITEIGLVLGFEDTSAFCRAFRRWTGTSPARFRLGRLAA